MTRSNREAPIHTETIQESPTSRTENLIVARTHIRKCAQVGVAYLKHTLSFDPLFVHIRNVRCSQTMNTT